MKHQVSRASNPLWSLCALWFGVLSFVVVVPGLAAQAPASAPSKSSKAWVPARTADGQPDIQGTWVNFDGTPFETPGGVPAQPAAPAGVSPPSHWADHDSPVNARRLSMVIEPPDGKVPLLPWAEARREYDLDHLSDSYVHETPWVRCITRGMPAGMFPAGTTTPTASSRCRATW